MADGEAFSAPRIAAPIEHGSAVIDGQFSAAAAFELALVMETPLPAPVELVEERSF